MKNQTEKEGPETAVEPDIEIERAQERLERAREEAAFVSGEMPDAAVEARIRKMSRRSFLWGALAVGATAGGIKWLGAQRAEDGVAWPLRRSLQTSEELWRSISRPSQLAPTYPLARARKIRVNGVIGMEDEDYDVASWKLRVEGLGEQTEWTLDEIKKLPKVEMTTELKCIEGWATVVHWGGVRLADFVRAHAPQNFRLPGYVGLATPDGGYYVGMETAAALHPQTLLCYEMNGQPLTPKHGAPLRLVTPIKYGIKNLKRIGTLSFTKKRPADYWAERGYDYYAGF